MNDAPDHNETAGQAERLPPFSSILLPVDDDDAFKRAASLTGMILRGTRLRPRRMDLLHVVTGTFLGELMKGLNLSAGETPAAGDMNELYRRHLNQRVFPLVKRCRELIDAEVGAGLAHTVVKDGDPEEIEAEISTALAANVTSKNPD